MAYSYPYGYGGGAYSVYGLPESPILIRAPIAFYQPMVVAPVWFAGINPLYAGVMSWMDEDVFYVWQQWQQDIRGKNLSLEARKGSPRIALRRNTSPIDPLTPQEIEVIIETIIATEPNLGADQYGHVDTTTTQQTTSTSTTTTTTLTQNQRNEAGQLYLQSLNSNGANMDPQQAQQTYTKITSGQSDDLAQHFLQTTQSHAPQQMITQQTALQQVAPQQMVPQQWNAPNPQQTRQQSESITTTTTTTSNNSSNNYHTSGQQMTQMYQQPMQAQQQMQNLSATQHQHQPFLRHTPSTAESHRQQVPAQRQTVGYGQGRPETVASRSTSSKPEASAKEKRAARLSSRKGAK